MISFLLRRKGKKKSTKSRVSDGSPFITQSHFLVRPVSLHDIASFSDVNTEQEKAFLFLQKLKVCKQQFVWERGKSPEEDPQTKEKELKLKQLIEIVDFVDKNGETVFHESIFNEFFEFVSANIFHGFAASSTQRSICEDPDEELKNLEPSYDHSQFVFELLLKFIISPQVDTKKAEVFIDQEFIKRVIGLIDSEDPRVRQMVKTLVHRIYGKYMTHRSYIRKVVSIVFYNYLYIVNRHNGIAELLEMMGSIIYGFDVPLREEHKSFLRRYLLPLHKIPDVKKYHGQLCYCVIQFCEKDPSLAVEIISGIVKYWPYTNSAKEILFLQEIEEILELTTSEDFPQIIPDLFHQINLCILSTHHKVAERALIFWDNEIVSPLLMTHSQQILPIIFPSLIANTREHWNLTVHQLSLSVMAKFANYDRSFFESCSKNHKNVVNSSNERKKKQEEEWKKIEETAIKKEHPLSWEPPLVERPSLIAQAEEPDLECLKQEQPVPTRSHVFRSSVVCE